MTPEPGVRQHSSTQSRAAQPPNPCLAEVCVTCSDTAVAVTVVRLLAGDLAIVDTGGGEEEVSIALVTATAGDTILVHAGEAIAVVGT
jgi:hydrogenase expression/formation protein HypC